MSDNLSIKDYLRRKANYKDLLLREEAEHPLDKYKSDLQHYDIKAIATANHPNGIPRAVFRVTQSPVLDGNGRELNKENNTEICKRIAFAKSWYIAIYKTFNNNYKKDMINTKNEYGYDRKIWDIAFNNSGIRKVYDAMISVLVNKSNSNMKMDEYVKLVVDEAQYQYTSKICKNLLQDNNRSEFLQANILNQLQSMAGVIMSPDISQIKDEFENENDEYEM